MTASENIVIGIVVFLTAAPILLIVTGFTIGVVRALKDGVYNDR